MSSKKKKNENGGAANPNTSIIEFEEKPSVKTGLTSHPHRHEEKATHVLATSLKPTPDSLVKIS